MDVATESITAALVAQLDERTKADGERWDLYRLAVGGWGVRLHSEGLSSDDDRTVTADTIEDALRLAAQSQRRVVVPRIHRRHHYSVNEFQPHRVTGGWRVVHVLTELDQGVLVKTRTAAIEAAERGVIRTNQAIDEWEAKWAPLVDGGIEGVDYVWRSW